MSRHEGVAVRTTELAGSRGALAGGVDKAPESVIKGGVVTLVMRFDARELEGSDVAGVAAPGGKFEASVLRGADFSHTMVFAGARMDKLTYAGLKGLVADLSNVTVQ